MRSVRDAYDLEARGVPAVVITSGSFLKKARQLARSLGLPEPAINALPPEIAPWVDDTSAAPQIEKAVEAIMPSIVRSVAPQAEEVPSR